MTRSMNIPAKCILVLLTTVLYFCSCGCGSIDKQPPKQKSVDIVSNAPDSSLIIVDTGSLIKPDSFIVTSDSAAGQLLLSQKEITYGVTIVYRRPTDSLVEAVFMSQVGVHEATGRNDGKDVEKYLRSVHLTKGSAWCAAFVKWCFDQAGVKTSITGWSPTAHNKDNIVMDGGSVRKQVQRGDVFTLYFPSLRRIGHTGFIRRKFGVNSFETVEGNTNISGSREGDGVYIKIRPRSSIYSITRWF